MIPDRSPWYWRSSLLAFGVARSTPPCSLAYLEDPQASSDGSRPDPDASDAIYSAPPCALAVTMLREPGADLETDKPPSTATSEPVMNEDSSQARNATAFATLLGSPGRWLLAQLSEICLKPVPKGGIYVLARLRGCPAWIGVDAPG